MTPLAIQTDTPIQPAVVLGKGLPMKIGDQSVHYRRKEVAKAREDPYTHRGSGEPLPLTRERLDTWAATFKKRLAKGIKPFITPRHVDHRAEVDARDTLGYVVGLERDGDSLYAIEQLIGDEALATAEKNDSSVYVVDGLLDADGDKYAESLHHLALTPDPALTNLGGTMTIAASAGGGSAISVPVYVLSATARRPTMKAETLSKLRAKFANGEHGVSDEEVAERAAAAALTDPPPDKTAEVTALSAKVVKLQGDLDAASQQVLSLSANAPEEPNGISLSLISRSFKTDRDHVIASGVISEAGMKEIDTLLMPTGKPAGVALALSAGSTDPLYSRLCEILRKNPGVKTGNGVIRASAADPPTHTSDIEQNDDKPITPERKKHLLELAGIFDTK